MTTTDRIKWFRDYFNVKMSESDFRKCEEMLKVETVTEKVEVIKYVEVVKEVIKEVVKTEYISSERKEKKTISYEMYKNDLMTLLKIACSTYSVHFSRCFISDRSSKAIRAKVYFSRMAKMEHPTIQDSELAEFLGCDRTTIIHYWRISKVNVPIKPFISVRTNKKKLYERKAVPGTSQPNNQSIPA